MGKATTRETRPERDRRRPSALSSTLIAYIVIRAGLLLAVDG